MIHLFCGRTKIFMPMEGRLPPSFFLREDVVQISRELLGKYLVTRIDGAITVGCIVETEAYRGPDDKACHAYNYRRTPRTSIMYEQGGHAYVYLCYGIHHLFNVVTGVKGQPHAVLVRAVEPIGNVELMLARRKMPALKPQLTAGPGALSQALGITTDFTGINMLDAKSPIWIEDRAMVIKEADIVAGPRVGVGYAEECAAWPWRFRIRDSLWTSKAK